jgi:hypothetical protein
MDSQSHVLVNGIDLLSRLRRFPCARRFNKYDSPPVDWSSLIAASLLADRTKLVDASLTVPLGPSKKAHGIELLSLNTSRPVKLEYFSPSHDLVRDLASHFAKSKSWLLSSAGLACVSQEFHRKRHFGDTFSGFRRPSQKAPQYIAPHNNINQWFAIAT